MIISKYPTSCNKKTWQYDFRDPNNTTDPNSILCGDLDENDWVNADDLFLMAGSWVKGQ